MAYPDYDSETINRARRGQSNNRGGFDQSRLDRARADTQHFVRQRQHRRSREATVAAQQGRAAATADYLRRKRLTPTDDAITINKQRDLRTKMRESRKTNLVKSRNAAKNPLTRKALAAAAGVAGAYGIADMISPSGAFGAAYSYLGIPEYSEGSISSYAAGIGSTQGINIEGSQSMPLSLGVGIMAGSATMAYQWGAPNTIHKQVEGALDKKLFNTTVQKDSQIQKAGGRMKRAMIDPDKPEGFLKSSGTFFNKMFGRGPKDISGIGKWGELARRGGNTAMKVASGMGGAAVGTVVGAAVERTVQTAINTAHDYMKEVGTVQQQTKANDAFANQKQVSQTATTTSGVARYAGDMRNVMTGETVLALHKTGGRGGVLT